jgi:hypothetical protein
MFIDSIQLFENACAETTRSHLESQNELLLARSQYDELFKQLYHFSCCHWGCHGKEHIFERLAGKCVNNLSLSYRAIEYGYYDEALSLVRSVGEIANLLNLFWRENSHIRLWLDADERTRIRKYGPAAVRKLLEAADGLVPFNQAHYQYLCETAVHPTPHSKPNAYSDLQQPILGVVFQESGFRIAFWNICWALSVVSGPISKIAVFDRKQADRMVDLTVPLFKSAILHVPQ